MRSKRSSFTLVDKNGKSWQLCRLHDVLCELLSVLGLPVNYLGTMKNGDRGPFGSLVWSLMNSVMGTHVQ